MYVCGELEDGLGNVGRALLLGDEDVAGRRGPLQAEKRVCGRLYVRGLYACGELGDALDLEAEAG